MDSYNELEYMVLAMVGNGICSGYSMRRHLQQLRGGRWSADSGTVYRILKRLERESHVALARRVGAPRRERTEYELTPSGRILMDGWLDGAVGYDDLSLLTDPLRTRVHFVVNLDERRRKRIIRRWAQDNRRLIAELERETDGKVEDDPQYWVMLNLCWLAKARGDWLRRLSRWAQRSID